MASEDLFETNVSLPKIPEDVLQDLCSRFLINIPNNEKNDMVRICFQIELAHWYYIDFCRQDDPDLPPCGMKAFISIIFTEFNFLNKSKSSILTIYENWKKYKVRVPVFGAILLDEALENCLLVQGFHNKTSWGFPKGKVNKDEGDMECAIREVWEEVGYDIAPLANSDQFLENTIHDHQIRLYIIPGVDGDYDFKPNTRGEIKEIRWFPVEFLPTHKKDTTPKEEFGLLANNFFMIHSFIKPLRKWIVEKKSSMSCAKLNALYSQRLSMSTTTKEGEEKKNDEKKDQQRKQRKDKEAEDFKRMHQLMNPLRSSKEDEDVLKSMLGLNSQYTSSGTTAQPEAIRKLLSGTVSPAVNDNTRHQSSTDAQKKKELREFGASPHGFRIGGGGGGGPSVSPKKDNNSKNNKSNKEPRNNRNTRDSSIQNLHKMGEPPPYKHQFRPFSPARNSPKHMSGEAAYKPHHYRSFSPGSSEEKRSKSGVRGPSPVVKIFGQHTTPKKTSPVESSGSEYSFSSSAFINFRLNYKEIMFALTQR